MTEINPEQIQQLLKEVEAQKREKAEAKLRWNSFLRGFTGGVLLTAAVLAVTFFVAIKPNLQSAQSALNQIADQRDACRARFTRSTVLWDVAGGVGPQRIPILNGLIDVSPGQVLGGDQAKPAWFVPADVNVVFYGDPGSATVLRLNEKGQVVSQSRPLTMADVNAKPSLLTGQ
jgi:hypothetical protein